MESITYTAVGADGASSAKAPVVLVRDEQVVRACGTKRWEKVADKAIGQDLEVKGGGEYKLDERHNQPTPLTFTCVYDARGGAVRSAAFEPGQAAWTPSGEVATGKTATLVCESTRDVQRVCPAPIKGNVRIIRQRSSIPCEAYKNWIWSLSGITVWGGCQAEFEFETR